MSEQITIRPLADDDNIVVITALLHRAYAQLAAMGFRYYATHQTPEVTAQRLQAGLPYVAEQLGTIVGTITLYPHKRDDKAAWYRQVGVYKFGQFGVEPRLQGQGLGLRMVRAVEAEARARGAQHIALDTAEGAKHLIAWYEGLGYQAVDHVQWEHTNYRSVVLSKPLSA